MSASILRLSYSELAQSLNRSSSGANLVLKFQPKLLISLFEVVSLLNDVSFVFLKSIWLAITPCLQALNKPQLQICLQKDKTPAFLQKAALNLEQSRLLLTFY